MLVPSNMLPLGTKAPFFTLPNWSEEGVPLSLKQGMRATVVMFICNHCPYVKHILPKLIDTILTYQEKGIVFYAINANDAIAYPEDAPDQMAKLGLPCPYLFDEDQTIAKAYQAACTPDFFVFDQAMACIYRGRFDGATPGNGVEVTGEDLIDALDAALDGTIVPESDQKPSMGCNIKWKDQ